MTRTPLARTSPKQRARLAAYAKVRKAWLADREFCEASIVGGCQNYANQVHHKRGKLGSLLCDTRFFLACCSHCHSCITDHPKWAREVGFTDAAKYWNISVPLEALSE